MPPRPSRFGPGGLAVGRLIGDRYRVEVFLDEGGSAAVYRVRHDQLGAPFALKVLRVPSPATVSRLLLEGRAMGALAHPNVVRIADLVDVDGNPALVVEYVDGPTLAEVLAVDPPSLPVADRLARGILSGVAAAHAAGLIHRDLKPRNVLLAVAHPDVLPKIADFGVARVLDAANLPHVTATGAMLGTPAYMAPEQHDDAANADARADVFACGTVLYELVAGEPAFPGRNALAILQRVASGEYAPIRELVPDLPDRMARAITAALSPDPADRPADGGALLAAWEDGTGVPPPDPAFADRVAAMRPQHDEVPFDANPTVTDSVIEQPWVGTGPTPDAPEERPTPALAPHARAVRPVFGVVALGVGAVALWAARAAWTGSEAAAPEPTVSRLTADPGLEADPSLSADGERLAWTDGVDVWLADPHLLEPPRNLTADLDGAASSPALSPDGAEVAFSLDGELLIRKVDGGPAARITSPAYEPTWAPDGRSLAVVTEPVVDPYERTSFSSRLVVVDRQTGARRALVPDADAIDPSWSPDGRWIAYSSGLGGIEVVSVDGETRITDLSWGLSPQWTERDLVFLLRSAGGGTGIYAVARGSDGAPHGQPRSVVPATLGDARGLAVAGDTFVVGVAERRGNLVGLPLDPDRLAPTGQRVELTSGAHRLVGPSFSPDGTRLAFTSAAPFEELLVSAPLPPELGPGLAWSAASHHARATRGPRFAPDGRSVWFYGTRAELGEGIYAQPLGGGEATLVSEGAGRRLWMAIPSPDGARMAVVDDELHLLLIDLSAPWGPQVAAGVEQPPLSGGWVPVDWSDDGRWLALTDIRGRIARLAVGESGRVGVPEVLIDDPDAIYAVWASDSARLLVAGGDTIARWDPEGGLVSIASVAPRRFPAAECLALSPDDRQLVGVAEEVSGDLVRVDFVGLEDDAGWWTQSQPRTIMP